MLNRGLSFLLVATTMLVASEATASESCEQIVDPVAKVTCWLGGPGGVVQPMGPGSGGTGGKDEEEK